MIENMKLTTFVLSICLWQCMTLSQTKSKATSVPLDAGSEVSGIYRVTQIATFSKDELVKSVSLAVSPSSDSLSGTITAIRKSGVVVTLHLSEFRNDINILSLVIGDGSLVKLEVVAETC